MPNYYLNSYAPLVSSKLGKLAVAEFGHKPFVDGSIRREPDFEHRFPSISCLCRAGKFAPRLKHDDIIGYVTKVGKYGTSERHQRLTAVLKVVEVFPTHAEAARWYISEGHKLPSNCMVPDNPPKLFEESHRMFMSTSCVGCARTHRLWDLSYRKRAKEHGRLVACESLWMELTYSAPQFTGEDLIMAFGYTPRTQNPGALDVSSFIKFLKQLKVSVQLSGR